VQKVQIKDWQKFPPACWYQQQHADIVLLLFVQSLHLPAMKMNPVNDVTNAAAYLWL
jgi:hypothetical protein